MPSVWFGLIYKAVPCWDLGDRFQIGCTFLMHRKLLWVLFLQRHSSCLHEASIAEITLLQGLEINRCDSHNLHSPSEMYIISQGILWNAAQCQTILCPGNKVCRFIQKKNDTGMMGRKNRVFEVILGCWECWVEWL